MSKAEAIQATINLLLLIKDKITDDTDVIYTYFETPAECRAEIDQCITSLIKGNTAAMKELDLLFAPTGALQEHSMANGWSKEYLKLSSQFDKFYRIILNK